MTGFDPAVFRAELRRESYRQPHTRSSAMTGTRLTDYDRWVIAKAREVTALSDVTAVREYRHLDDPLMAYAETFGEAQYLLTELTAIVSRLDEDSSDE
jgi:hypothetical protein